MADELLTSLYNSNSIWWNTLKGTLGATGSSRSPISASLAPFSYSSATSDIASLFVDSPHPAIDFGLPSPTIDWNDLLLTGKPVGNSSPHALKPFFQKQVQTRGLNPIEHANSAQFRQASCPSPSLQDLVPEHNLINSSQQSAMPLIINSTTSPNPFSNLPPQYNMVTTDQSTANTSSSSYYTATRSRFHEEITSSSSSSSGGKRKNMKNGKEPAPKKPRIQMPSPLPTFNVRKEKLQDRVTALQQLVSPFGKTDTASVLHEAIDYIKFLHDQVRVLSAPYLKAGHAMHKQQNPKGLNQDLRSRGLCTVPISTTFAIALEPPIADIYWTPNFGASFIR